MGSYNNLPQDAVEIKVYMRSGDSKMYIVPIQKNESKIEIFNLKIKIKFCIILVEKNEMKIQMDFRPKGENHDF